MSLGSEKVRRGFMNTNKIDLDRSKMDNKSSDQNSKRSRSSKPFIKLENAAAPPKNDLMINLIFDK